jgi:hypothetical protein
MTKPIDLNSNSDSFADVPESEREALSQAFQFADIWTTTACRQDVGDGQVFQDEFITAIWTNPKEFQDRGFSANRRSDFARFRDQFDYLPDFTTGQFVKVDNESAHAEISPADQGSEDVWSAFDKIWKDWEPVLGRAERVYDRSSAFTNAVSEINAIYVASGGQKNVMRPLLDVASRSARYSLEGRDKEMMDDLILPAIEENAQILDPNPSDGLDYDLTGLDSGEQAALSSALDQCETKIASEDKTEAKAWGFGCTGFLYAYSLTLAHENGLDEKLAEQYPLF